MLGEVTGVGTTEEVELLTIGAAGVTDGVGGFASEARETVVAVPGELPILIQASG